MRLFILGLFISVMAATVAPAQAQIVIGHGTLCTAANAQFNTFEVEDDKRLDGKPYRFDRHSPLLRGETQITACEVDGHFIRINVAAFMPGRGPCGAIPFGFVSVWLDGVKVVDRREWNEHEQCLAVLASYADSDTVRVSRIIVNDRLHLTVCQKDSKVPDKAEACELSDLSGGRPDPESLYYGPVKRTPHVWRLVTGPQDPCAVVTRQLNGPAPDGGVLRAVLAGSKDLQGLGIDPVRSYSLDVDNDGRVDTVDLSVMGGGDWDWRGPDLQTFSLRKAWPEDEELLTAMHPDSFRFVRIGGRIYAWHINDERRGFGHVSDGEVGANLFGDMDGVTTRHLIELHNDGTATTVCAWTPLPHPEEFL